MNSIENFHTTDSVFISKQRDHCYAQEPIDEDGNLTMYALGGFVPEDPVDMRAHFAEYPTFKKSYAPPNVVAPDESIIRQENSYRLTLVQKLNDFLRVLASSTCSVAKACKVVRFNRFLVEDLRTRITAFDSRWREIYAEITDEIEGEAYRRAVKGVERPIFSRDGTEVGTERRYSDSLLALMLQSRRPDPYKPRLATELTGKDGAPLGAEREMSDADLDAAIERGYARFKGKLEVGDPMVVRDIKLEQPDVKFE